MTDPRIRYSKVSRRLWNDAGFRGLSRAQPNAQTLWLRLLTGPELQNIPGIFLAWEAGLAQSLGWSLEGFREAFREVSREAFAKADWEVGLVWVPNAIAHNQPQSPNVIRSWLPTWDVVPECALKTEAYWALRAFAEGMGEGFRKAFAKGIANPSPNQEQEQEQEQEQNGRARALVGETLVSDVGVYTEHPSGIRPRSGPVNAAADGAFGMAVSAWADGIRAVTGTPCTTPIGGPLKTLLAGFDAHRPADSEPVEWARSAGIEYAQFAKARRATVSPFGFVDWLNSGRPATVDGTRFGSPEPVNDAPSRRRLAPVRRVDPSRTAQGTMATPNARPGATSGQDGAIPAASAVASEGRRRE